MAPQSAWQVVGTPLFRDNGAFPEGTLVHGFFSHTLIFLFRILFKTSQLILREKKIIFLQSFPPISAAPRACDLESRLDPEALPSVDRALLHRRLVCRHNRAR